MYVCKVWYFFAVSSVYLHLLAGFSAVLGTHGLVQNRRKGNLRTGLFAGEKRKREKRMAEARPKLLREMVDVLRMDLAELDSWDWAEPVPCGFCSQVKGKYRAFMDEEIHTALLLQWLGTNLGVALRRAFMNRLNKSGAWVHLPHHAMSKEDRQRRHAFLGNDAIKARNFYFMVQLLESPWHNGEWSEYNDTKPAEGRSGSGPAARQSFLRLLTTEMLLHRNLYGQFTILASDFETFGPSMPHATVRTGLLAVLPAVLFCLDFAVHARTNGAALYLFHDALGRQRRALECAPPLLAEVSGP
ncbi:hypothetical protein DFJ73DRAFT_770073 [Zopfochytrium polystomum]|nr:hypothetical protein DFJ73DRAFT_770073 [Zopfochytrium polystomum]